MNTPFDLPCVERLLIAGIEEDVGRGDLTTRLTIPAGTRAQARIVAKQDGVLAGLPLVDKIFSLLGGDVDVKPSIQDGCSFAAGTTVLGLKGDAARLLNGERLSLNLLQNLSGIATLTRAFVAEVAGTKARIVDTRKTVPGMRVLAKYAVRAGGGFNHRMGLDDGVLIKDNHIAAAGSLFAAVTRAREAVTHTAKIEVECRNENEVREALRAKADVILLDNMDPARLRSAVVLIAGRALIEASGGVNLTTVRAIAETGVDLISVGALTHSAPAIDLNMTVELIT